MPHVQPIKLGGVNCFLVQDEGLILIDTGTPKQHDRTLKQVKKLGLDPYDIELIVITYGHGDPYPAS